jgi:protein-S-isoprenylcysteine O-methyltransferase Ste14
MTLNHIILAALWIIYCVLHSVLASEWIKKKLRQRMKNYKWYRLWYTLFALIFLIAIVYFQIKMTTIVLFKQSSFTLVSGIIISFSGLVLMLTCIRKYFMNLSGLRSLFIENFSNELQITGVHKYVRHPLYLGTFAFLWGLILLLPYASLLISNAIITIYTLIGIELEERKLLTEFGFSYSEYRRTVPKLIPFIKPKRKP